MFLAKGKSENGIPFELKILNETTAIAMNEARLGINMETVTLETLKTERESQKSAQH